MDTEELLDAIVDRDSVTVKQTVSDLIHQKIFGAMEEYKKSLVDRMFGETSGYYNDYMGHNTAQYGTKLKDQINGVNHYDVYHKGTNKVIGSFTHDHNRRYGTTKAAIDSINRKFHTIVNKHKSAMSEGEVVDFQKYKGNHPEKSKSYKGDKHEVIYKRSKIYFDKKDPLHDHVKGTESTKD